MDSQEREIPDSCVWGVHICAQLLKNKIHYIYWRYPQEEQVPASRNKKVYQQGNKWYWAPRKTGMNISQAFGFKKMGTPPRTSLIDSLWILSTKMTERWWFGSVLSSAHDFPITLSVIITCVARSSYVWTFNRFSREEVTVGHATISNMCVI